MMQKSKPKNIKITGKIIGISEEKDLSKINILLDYNNLEIETSKKEFRLGDKVSINFNFIVNEIKKP